MILPLDSAAAVLQVQFPMLRSLSTYYMLHIAFSIIPDGQYGKGGKTILF